MPAAERARFYRDPAWRDRARADVARQWHYTFDKVFVQETAAHPELADGPSLGELAAQRGVNPLDVLCDLEKAIWRSPGIRPRCSGSPAGAASRPGTSPTWSRSIPRPSGWSGWSGSGTCPRARTGLSPAATGCTRSG